MEVAADAVAVNGASFAAGAPVAAGSLVSLFGDFAGSATEAASALPLPRKLGETEVRMEGATVPLLFVSPQQINFQLPHAIPPGQSVVEVHLNGQRVSRGSVTVLPAAPGVFVVVNNADGQINSASNPVRRGDVLVIFATGQGEVSPVVEDGTAAPVQPLAVTPSQPTVTIGDRPGTVLFSGLTPGFVGLWQINVAIPADAPIGSAVPLVVTQGLSSNSIPVAVE